MFLSEWREFPSAPCLVGGEKKLDNSSRLDVVEIVRVPDMLPSLRHSRRLYPICFEVSALFFDHIFCLYFPSNYHNQR